MSQLAVITREIEQKRGELAKLFADHKKDGEYTHKQEQIEEINRRNTELGELVQKQESLRTLAETEAKNAEELARLRADVKRPAFGGGDPEPEREQKGKRAERKTLGALFIESKQFDEFKGGRLGARVELADYDLKTLFATSAGWDPEDLRTGKLVFDEQESPKVADIVPKTTTGMSTVLYMEETTYTNNAAEAAEGAAYGEAALALTEQSSEVRKIAVSLPVTDEQLEDVQRIQDYLDNRLRNMLRQRLDQQLLTGNGTAPNLRGLLNVSGINTQAKGADPVPDAIYKAIVKCRSVGFAEPSHCVLHPNDLQDIRLLRTADGLYIWGSPSEGGPVRIWGLPVVETTYETENTGLVGDFRNYCELALRRGIAFEMTNSHDVHFTTGKKMIRADFRVAFICYRPKAFATVTGI